MKRLLKLFFGIAIILGIIISVSNFFPKTAKAEGMWHEFHVDEMSCYGDGTTCAVGVLPIEPQ
jgi:hypothetical protein